MFGFQIPDFCRLGPQDTVSIDFEVVWHFLRDPGVICVAMEIRETDPRSSLEAGGLFSNMADFRGRRHLEFLIRFRIGPIFQGAILDLGNNSIHCSPDNSLLSLSAPDWLPVIWACITTLTFWL